MYVCVTTMQTGAGDAVDPRFGRCDRFSFVDTDSGETTHERNALASGAGGVGAKAAQMVADRGVQAVITGQVGPNAFRVLAAAGIEVYTAAEKTLSEAVEDLREGRLAALAAPSGPARHAGH
jgi:predicted Fe-Mo cluster-binding NifX family protein